MITKWIVPCPRAEKKLLSSCPRYIDSELDFFKVLHWLLKFIFGKTSFGCLTYNSLSYQVNLATSCLQIVVWFLDDAIFIMCDLKYLLAVKTASAVKVAWVIWDTGNTRLEMCVTVVCNRTFLVYTPRTFTVIS